MYSVLLIDDEPRAIESLLYFVQWQKLGFQVSGTCDNGEDALELIIRTLPDIVITDIRMPSMDGLELISQLQERMKTPPEIIVLSGYNEFSYARRAIQLGVRHYLLKPVMEEEATEVLRQVHHRLETRLTARFPVEWKQGGRLLDIDRFLVEHYRSNLSIKQVAAMFYINPVYLGKLYNEKFGFSLLDRIHNLRIEESKRLLRTTDLATKEIAEQAGYTQYHYFLKQFEKRAGMKPKDYRAHFGVTDNS